MKITVLGCGAAYPRPGGACAGFLLEEEETRVWLDAGNGTFSRLTSHAPFDGIDAIVVSHSHGDHTADLLPMMYALGFDTEIQGLPVHAPGDVPQRLAVGLGEGSHEIFSRVFAFRPADEPFEVGTMRFEPFPTHHPVETYGFRISGAGGTLVYTADTAYFAGLVESCAEADLLLSEATFLRGDEAPGGLHLWAEEAGRVAAKAGARRLALTHVWGTSDPRVAVQEASEAFDGPVEAAVEGAVYDV